MKKFKLIVGYTMLVLLSPILIPLAILFFLIDSACDAMAAILRSIN